MFIRGGYDEEKHQRFFYAVQTLMHRVYRKCLMRGYLKYLRKQQRGKGMVIMTVSYDPSSETCWKAKDITIQIFYRVASWTLLQLRKQKKSKVMDVTPNDDLRQGSTAGADFLERAANYSWCNWDDGSQILFWHWPRCYQRAVHDGTKIFIHRKHLTK